VERIELHNIVVPDPAKFEASKGKPVEVPVRAYAPGARVTLMFAD
jgi:hypothetical protein